MTLLDAYYQGHDLADIAWMFFVCNTPIPGVLEDVCHLVQSLKGKRIGNDDVREVREAWFQATGQLIDGAICPEEKQWIAEVAQNT